VAALALGVGERGGFDLSVAEFRNKHDINALQRKSQVTWTRAAAASLIATVLLANPAGAATTAALPVSPGSLWGLAVMAVFVAGYALVFLEERLHLPKSKPVLVAAGLIWILVAGGYAAVGEGPRAAELLRHNALEYAELLFFLLAAMSYINAMIERGVFDALRGRLVGAGLGLRPLFWITGALAFVISPVADNLTTALVMGTVVMAIGGNNRRFVGGSCVNIVVAANAGGAFSPFGDITTLMIWQAGMVEFTEFFALFVPSLVNWLVPAALIGAFMPGGKPARNIAGAQLRQGGLAIVAMFLATIAGTVTLNHVLGLPAFLGMMLGLGALKVFGHFLSHRERRGAELTLGEQATQFDVDAAPRGRRPGKAFDSFDALRELEWDTLLFFYGILLCVGGLGAMGYLALLSNALYGGIGATGANIAIGVLSAAVDNIPLTFAVLSMKPVMDHGQWLLLTFTAGTGGSLLSVGSAAGVALMGIAQGGYTFSSHLRWAWAVALGYVAGIAAHLYINAAYFTGVG